MKITKQELHIFNGDDKWIKEHGEGYRIVYFYNDNTHYVGAYCKNIEGFMFEFCDNYPIFDEEDVPKFISIDDLLSRYLDRMKDISSVALYKTDGTCIATYESKIINWSKDKNCKECGNSDSK